MQQFKRFALLESGSAGGRGSAGQEAEMAMCKSLLGRFLSRAGGEVCGILGQVGGWGVEGVLSYVR